MKTNIQEMFQSYLMDAVKKGFIEKDTLTIGNFAFFAEHVLLQPDYQVFKEVMELCLKENRSQEFNLLVSSAIYQRAKAKEMGTGLDEQLQAIYEAYRKGTLEHFCVLTDERYFPEWVKRYEYHEKDKEDFTPFSPIVMG